MQPLSGPDIPVIANYALTTERDGVAATAGQVIYVQPIMAAALTYQHKARFFPATNDAPVRRKRGRPRKDSTYNRRDLTAKQPETEE